MDFSGDEIPRISLELWSNAIRDIEINNAIRRPKPASRMAANHIEEVVSKCSENAMITTFPILSAGSLGSMQSGIRLQTTGIVT